MKPYQLIGLPYRLGADPIRHGAADCLSLCRVCLGSYGIQVPQGKRSWYRRLKNKDYDVFFEELNRWGVKSPPKLGTLGLCKSENGLGMASFYEDGWLSFQERFNESTVIWTPLSSLTVIESYYPRN